VGLAPADLHADRAGAPVPARAGQRARVGAAAGRGSIRRRCSSITPPTPSLAPLLARLSLFNVFASPWFAAIYLLLFASLAGCVIPRTFRLAGSARQQPPQAPANLSRLPLAARHETTLAPAEALAAAAAVLSAKRFRLRTGDGWSRRKRATCGKPGTCCSTWRCWRCSPRCAWAGCSATRRTGCWWWATRSRTPPPDLDAFHPGRAVSAADLQPFTIALDSFQASYITSGALRGQPSRFDARIRYSPQPGAAMRGYSLRVNHPLSVDGVRVFLIGHGYAPVFRVTDGTGRVVFDGPVPFIAVEQAGLTSEGVDQGAGRPPPAAGVRRGVPATAVDEGGKLGSAFPAPLNPVVSLVSYAGEPGMNSGPAQSVYQLDTSGLRQLPVKPRPLAPGPVDQAPGRRRDPHLHRLPAVDQPGHHLRPGHAPALIAGMTALAACCCPSSSGGAGCSSGRPGPDGSTVVDVGGLARSDAAGGFEAEFPGLAGEISRASRAASRPSGPGQAPVPARRLPPLRPGAPPARADEPDRGGVRAVPINEGWPTSATTHSWSPSWPTPWRCWPSRATSPSGGTRSAR
jgi:cytochrome c biogenesis protein